MANLSTDKEINTLCNRLLATGLWQVVRKGKHTVIKHVAKGARMFFSVPCTPSDPRAYSNFKRDYLRYLRSYLIQTGTIIR